MTDEVFPPRIQQVVDIIAEARVRRLKKANALDNGASALDNGASALDNGACDGKNVVAETENTVTDENITDAGNVLTGTVSP